MRLTWLSFRREFASDWLSFQNESTNSDFYTADSTLSYSGKVTGFTSNGDQVKLELKDSNGKVINTNYVTPDTGGSWSWDDQANSRLDGNYTLESTIVDKAGNRVNLNNEGFSSQKITIDTEAMVSTNAIPSFTPSPAGSGSTPSIQKLDFSKILEDGSFNLYLNNSTLFQGFVKDGIIIIQNKDFTNSNNLSTGISAESNTIVTGKSIHLDFTDQAGNIHKDFIDLTTNSYLLGNEIKISFIV